MAEKMRSKYSSDEELIQSRITIPTYFEEIIVPQMSDYYSDKYVNFDSKPVVCCPFHSENEGSFRYYSDTNTYHCFGCGVGGPTQGVVSLHMRFIEKTTGKKLTKKEAIKFLIDYFIDGKQTDDSFVRVDKVKEVESTSQEMILYTMYKNETENALLADNSISFETKLKIWDKLDKVDVLLGLGKVNASEVVKELKDLIRKELRNG